MTPNTALSGKQPSSSNLSLGRAMSDALRNRVGVAPFTNAFIAYAQSNLMESSLSPQEKQKYITAQNTPGTREYYAIRIAAAGQYGDRSEVARLSGLLRNMPAIPPPAAVSPSQIIGWANLSPAQRQLMIDSGQVIGTRTSPPPNAPSVPSAPPSPALGPPLTGGKVVIPVALEIRRDTIAKMTKALSGGRGPQITQRMPRLK